MKAKKLRSGLSKFYICLCVIAVCMALLAPIRFFKQARAKSKALEEIIAGNEFFKRRHVESASAFKESHKTQSTQTRQIVAQMKT